MKLIGPQFKKSMMCMAILLILCSFTSCDKHNDTVKGQMKELTLRICLFGSEPSGFNEVLAETEDRLRDTLNVNLDFNFITPSEYKKTLQMQLMAERKVALAYDAPWMTNNELVSRGMYYDLEDYFNNDTYPGLKKAFTEEFIEANKMDGHLYWIPIMGVEKDMVILHYREDLREKLGVAPITDMESLQKYLDVLQETYPGIVPIDLGRKGFYEMFNSNVLERNAAGIFEPFGTGNMELYWEVAISKDGKTCLGATTYGDEDELFTNYPVGYQYNYYLERFNQFVKWNKYLIKNSITVSTPSGYDSKETFVNGDSAVCFGTLSHGSTESELQKQYPDAKVGFFPLYDEQREMKEGSIYTTHIANNFVGVPITATEEQKERTILFLDWLFSDQSNYNLFRYGIEGRDYEIVNENQYTIENAANQYEFPYYELVWNPDYELQNAKTPEILLKYQEYMNLVSTYVSSPLSGFVYNSTNVGPELAAVNDQYSKIWFQLFHGTFGNAEQALSEYHEKAEAAGLEAIRQDLIRQVQAFLDEKNR
jgi:ABC-type glycerol-3-phosphate transport system substrate-binding protein